MMGLWAHGTVTANQLRLALVCFSQDAEWFSEPREQNCQSSGQSIGRGKHVAKYARAKVLTPTEPEDWVVTRA